MVVFEKPKKQECCDTLVAIADFVCGCFDFELLVIVLVERVEGIGVVGDDVQQSVGFVYGEFFVGNDVGEQLDGFLQVVQLFQFGLLLDGVAFDEVFFEDFVGPDAELGCMDRINSISNG